MRHVLVHWDSMSLVTRKYLLFQSYEQHITFNV